MHHDLDSDFWHTHRVSYGETDSMGVLYYAEYLHIFERARSQFIRGKGLSYAEVEKRGIFLPVREAQCRYRRPFRYDDLIRIHTGITQWGKASLVFRYVLWNEAKDAVMAEGMTQHACVNKAGKPVAVPDWLKNPFTANHPSETLCVSDGPPHRQVPRTPSVPLQGR